MGSGSLFAFLAPTCEGRWAGKGRALGEAWRENRSPPVWRTPWVSLPPGAAAPIVPQLARPPAFRAIGLLILGAAEADRSNKGVSPAPSVLM